MKKILITTTILIALFIFIVPPYNELNNLSIIDSIGVEKKNETYTLYLREIIPTKTDNGIDYKYKIYKEDAKSLKECLNKLYDKKKKKLYLKKTKYLVTNINSDYVRKYIPINPKSIYHFNKNIEKKLKSIR